MIRRLISLRAYSQPAYQKWSDIPLSDIPTLNLNNLLNSLARHPASLQSIESKERLMLVNILQCVRIQLSSNDDDISKQAILDKLRICMHENIGIDDCFSNQGLLQTRKKPVLVPVAFERYIIRAAPSGTFADTIHRLITTMNLSNGRHARSLVEQVIMESIFGHAVQKKTPSSTRPRTSPLENAGVENVEAMLNTAADTAALQVKKDKSKSNYDDLCQAILGRTMVGLHADHHFRLPLPPADHSSELGPDSLWANIHASYISTPHYKLPKPNEKLSKTSKVDYSQRALCCVFISSGLPRGITGLLAMENLNLDLTRLTETVCGKSRPLNVVITDGFRWHFSRHLSSSFPGNGKLFGGEIEGVDLETIADLHQVDDMQQIKDCLKTCGRDKSMETAPPDDQNGRVVYSEVYSIAKDEIEDITGILRWWIRGLNVPAVGRQKN